MFRVHAAHARPKDVCIALSYSGRGLPSLDPALLSVGGPWGMGMGRTYVRTPKHVRARAHLCVLEKMSSKQKVCRSSYNCARNVM